MAVNGPLKMYKVQPLFDFSPEIALPTCMYKMKNLHDSSPQPKSVKEVINEFLF